MATSVERVILDKHKEDGLGISFDILMGLTPHSSAELVKIIHGLKDCVRITEFNVVEVTDEDRLSERVAQIRKGKEDIKVAKGEDEMDGDLHYGGEGFGEAEDYG